MAFESMQEFEALLASGIATFEPAAGWGIPVVELGRDREVAGFGQTIGHAADVWVYREELVCHDHPRPGLVSGRAGEEGRHGGSVGDGDLERCVRDRHASSMGTDDSGNQSGS